MPSRPVLGDGTAQPSPCCRKYKFAEWQLAHVSTDHHVEFERFFYSAPHSLLREKVDVPATSQTIEIFFKVKRVAAHQRRYGGAVLEPTQTTAQFAPPLPGMVAGALPALGSLDRSTDRGARHAILARRLHPNRGSEQASAFSGSSRRSTRRSPKPFRPVLP
ncbi:Mu transposase domain-containing protein [Mesorhizobium sp. L48C026A00]|uniref:Mu transposase domain-containing protein n=1 Tax=Mesorhizobium sp. L48C026A00 TaxID=1287182 RepID=UPI00358FABFA